MKTSYLNIYKFIFTFVMMIIFIFYFSDVYALGDT